MLARDKKELDLAVTTPCVGVQGVPHSSALLKLSSIPSKRGRSVYSSANAANAFGMIDSPPELGSALPQPYARIFLRSDMSICRSRTKLTRVSKRSA